MNKEKGFVGCVTCGTSLGCLLPLAFFLGFVLIFAVSNYFNQSYYWEDTDTWMVVGLAVIAIPSAFFGILQAAIGIWGLLGFFDQNVTPDDLNSLPPIPSSNETTGT